MNINLDFALFNGNFEQIDEGSGLVYTNLLDEMLDSLIFAMAKLGYPDIRLVISETGWPTAGDIEQPGTYKKVYFELTFLVTTYLYALSFIISIYTRCQSPQRGNLQSKSSKEDNSKAHGRDTSETGGSDTDVHICSLRREPEARVGDRATLGAIEVRWEPKLPNRLDWKRVFG